MGFAYRHCALPDDWIFVAAPAARPRRASADAIARAHGARSSSRARGDPADPQPHRRQHLQEPAGRARPGELIDAAGCRGLRQRRRHGLGEALQLPDQHRHARRAADLEGLGEEVRRRVRAATGVELEWEIRRIGVADARGRRQAMTA